MCADVCGTSPCARIPRRGNLTDMLTFIVVLLIIWLVFTVLGFVIEGLFWLAVIGIVLFLATAAYGWIKRKSTT